MTPLCALARRESASLCTPAERKTTSTFVSNLEPTLLLDLDLVVFGHVFAASAVFLGLCFWRRRFRTTPKRNARPTSTARDTKTSHVSRDVSCGLLVVDCKMWNSSAYVELRTP